MPRRNDPQITYDTEPYFQQIPRWTAYVDPGPTTGMVLIKGGAKAEAGDSYDQVFWPITLTACEAQDRFAEFCVKAHTSGRTVNLVIEEYRIYPDKLAIHAGKEVPTAEIIGGFLYIARRMMGQVVKVPAQVKQTTKSMMKGRGIGLTGVSEHAKDAETIMWYTTFRKMEENR